MFSIPVRCCDCCGHLFRVVSVVGVCAIYVVFSFVCSVVLLLFCGTALRVHPAVTRLTVYRRHYVLSQKSTFCWSSKCTTVAKIRQETATHVSEKHRISPISDLFM